ncbi:UNVERIFIED_CONTAM: hypothetical protein Cloal_0137 [Acetivibrio alkalicellulosi]
MVLKKKNRGKIEHKDSIFRYIFSEEKNFIQLYYDLTGLKLKEDELELCTLNSLVINELKNDVAFKTKDDRLIVMVEHQSTINNNMPLRCLLYFAEFIKKYINDKSDTLSLHQRRVLKIPTPEFYIVYNGKEELKDKKLSLDINFKHTTKKLELEVDILDINFNRLPKEILERKDALDGYSFLVEKVRQYKEQEKLPLDEAIDIAIKDTKNQGYLVEYLNRKEFMTMLLTTWTIEDQIAFLKKEAEDEKKELIKKAEEMKKLIKKAEDEKKKAEDEKKKAEDERKKAEGERKKAEDEKIAMVKEMLSDGEPVEKIMRYTKVSETVIKKLQENLRISDK